MQFGGLAGAQSPAITHSIFLIGDGGELYVKDDPISRRLPRHLASAPGDVIVLFLGDNIYPAGLPDRGHKHYAIAEQSLSTQVGWISKAGVRGIFIPGNHDWQHWGRKGWDYILNQQAWLDSLRDPRITSLPRNGCPGPVQIPLNAHTRLVILDTQWFLHKWEKPTDRGTCGVTNLEEVMLEVEEIFRSNPDERFIIAAHHPLITYGEHGGVFTWKAHLFPLHNKTRPRLYLPLPVLGSIYVLYRSWIGHRQDTPHPQYKQFGRALQRIMRAYPNTLYAAGHEHALQYIVKDNIHYVVSGSASKTEEVRRKDHAVFADHVRGYAVLSIYDNGAMDLAFWRVDDRLPEGVSVFTTSIPSPVR